MNALHVPAFRTVTVPLFWLVAYTVSVLGSRASPPAWKPVASAGGTRRQPVVSIALQVAASIALILLSSWFSE